jgi:hypothetical protein
MFLFLLLHILVGLGAAAYLLFRKGGPIRLFPPRTTDEYYAKALNELMERKIDQGVFARAVADSNGSEAAARSLYVRYRAKVLAEKAAAQESR